MYAQAGAHAGTAAAGRRRTSGGAPRPIPTSGSRRSFLDGAWTPTRSRTARAPRTTGRQRRDRACARAYVEQPASSSRALPLSPGRHDRRTPSAVGLGAGYFEITAASETALGPDRAAHATRDREPGRRTLPVRRASSTRPPGRHERRRARACTSSGSLATRPPHLHAPSSAAARPPPRRGRCPSRLTPGLGPRATPRTLRHEQRADQRPSASALPAASTSTAPTPRRAARRARSRRQQRERAHPVVGRHAREHVRRHALGQRGLPPDLEQRDAGAGHDERRRAAPPRQAEREAPDRDRPRRAPAACRSHREPRSPAEADQRAGDRAGAHRGGEDAVHARACRSARSTPSARASSTGRTRSAARARTRR